VLETADGGFWMNKRSDKDIWANMFDFPLLETDIAIEFSVLQKSPNWKALWGIQAPEMQHISQVFKHQLTHQTIYATFYACSLPEINKKWEKHFIQVDAEMLHKYALPRLIDKYLLSRKEAEQITLTLN
jgi:A/G-specific adenine glycosylase